MKTDKELLKLLLEAIQNDNDNKNRFWGFLGMCVTVSTNAILINKTTASERNRLIVYLNSNKPLLVRINFIRIIFKNSAYWWDRGNIKPRIEWLTKEIEKQV